MVSFALAVLLSSVVAVVDVDLYYYGSLPQPPTYVSSDHESRRCVVLCMIQ